MLTLRSPQPASSHGTLDARRALLQRILESSVFAKSERLRSLLTFVCEMTLQGRERELNEQRIGEAVFGRSPDYDSAVDGIVRTQASRLRVRLDTYFKVHGADEPVRIVIPRGGYIPRFEPVGLSGNLQAISPLEVRPDLAALNFGIAAPPAEAAVGNLARQSRRPRIWKWLASPALPWLLVAVLLASGAWIALRRARLQAASKPTAPHPIWNQIFSPAGRTLIVPGDSGLVMWEGMTGTSVHLPEYLSGNYRSEQVAAGSPVQQWARSLGNRRYTAIVDLEMVQALAQTARDLNAKFDIRYSRDVRPNDLKQGNVVLLGTNESTPWVELFEPNMNFYFHDDFKKRVFTVYNRAPTGSEPRQWDSVYDDPQHRIYAVVAYLPNLNGDGHAVILEGTSMAGTESAWDFISDESQLTPFLARIRRKDGSIPHFEVLLGNSNMNGSAGKNEVLAWRTSR